MKTINFDNKTPKEILSIFETSFKTKNLDRFLQSIQIANTIDIFSPKRKVHNAVGKGFRNYGFILAANQSMSLLSFQLI